MSTNHIKSFGFLVRELGKSQMSNTLITNLNALLHETYTYCPIVFVQNYSQASLPVQFPRMYQEWAYDFPHPLIASDIYTANILDKCIGTKIKLFYVYDLEWFYDAKLIYDRYMQLYQNLNIELIARSDRHFKVLEKCWKKPLGVVHDYNYKELTKIIDKLYKTV